MNKPATAMLHYSAPPVIGGVEVVIAAHVGVFRAAGYPLAVIAGQGESSALPAGAEFVHIPEMDSQHPEVARLSSRLEVGEVPPGFDDLVAYLSQQLAPVLRRFDHAIIHNLFAKHFNLPLTAALDRLLQAGDLRGAIAWGHDFTWTSPNSRHKVHPGYPWDLLRTRLPGVTYVVVSKQRQREQAQLFACPPEQVRVIYNGVDPGQLLGLSPEGQQLLDRLDILESDLVLLMPVRVTQAKNIEFALQVVAAIKALGSRPKLILTGPPDPHDAASLDYFRSLQDLRRQLGVEAEMRFIFESGPDPLQPYFIDSQVVGDLFRVSDVMFMPSHREGFGMPVLEAGLAGLQVVSTPVPAAQEIGQEDVIVFDPQDDPGQVARRILEWAAGSPGHHLRRRVRQEYTWGSIFRRQIEPLLHGAGVV